MILLTALCVGVIGLVGYWSMQPKLVTLVSEIDHDKMSAVVDALDKAGISYEVGGAGGVLRVDKRSFAKARLLAKKHGVSTDDAMPESAAGSMWLDPTDRRNLENRKLEASLEASVKKYAAVQAVEIHLNVPARGPFERKVSDPTASVMLTLMPGSRLTDENVLAIASLVAFAVPDLAPEAVGISDRDGNIYVVPDELAGNINGQIEFTNQYERKLARKAETQLNHFLGFGNASVQVSLDMTFERSNKTVVEVDAEGKVVTQENLKSETKTEERGVAGGPAGVASNIGDGTGSASGSESEIVSKEETIDSTYLVPKTEESLVNNTPTRNLMTVSVLVNSLAESIQQEDGTVATDMQNRVEQIVRTAVGFREDTDQIFVDFQPFHTTDPAEVVTPFNWVQLNEIIRNASLAVAAIVAMLIGFLTLRRFQKTTAPAQSVQVPSEKAANISQLHELARSNPEVVARIMQSWAGGSRQPTESQVPDRKAA